MLKNRTVSRSAALLVATPLLAASLAACGAEDTTPGDDNSTQTTVTETASAQPSENTDDDGASSAESASSSPSAAGNSAEKPVITLNGQPVDNTAFAESRCARGEDDGRPQIEYEAGTRGSDNELDIDIEEESLRLDSLELELAGEEWEADDADKAAASVEGTGDGYAVKALATNDDTNEKRDLEVSFSCAL
ncbi:hypothetical protein [Corynebacterium suicordis]|uniref:Secreted protein n=1 Tax=Corynebacterium suicordis DSM 45110 TaxID=1121369 RepID=A0ABR9ZN29_9CORY|nr:hypothetical protein [Corynebacterium suicordis]MBF4554022.1 hypothetical protein [Corynebacterium suicordis DSM 45110]MDR6277000.1 hypothetical protein [Corynebacterium suicordis]